MIRSFADTETQYCVEGSVRFFGGASRLLYAMLHCLDSQGVEAFVLSWPDLVNWPELIHRDAQRFRIGPVAGQWTLTFTWSGDGADHVKISGLCP